MEEGICGVALAPSGRYMPRLCVHVYICPLTRLASWGLFAAGMGQERMQAANQYLPLSARHCAERWECHGGPRGNSPCPHGAKSSYTSQAMRELGLQLSGRQAGM